MLELSPEALAEWLQSDRPKPVLLDVREPWEFAIGHIDGALLMPMSGITSQSRILDDEAEIVVICHHGIRSQQVGIFLERHGFWHIYSLAGGMDRWSHEIDPNIPLY